MSPFPFFFNIVLVFSIDLFLTSFLLQTCLSRETNFVGQYVESAFSPSKICCNSLQKNSKYSYVCETIYLFYSSSHFGCINIIYRLIQRIFENLFPSNIRESAFLKFHLYTEAFVRRCSVENVFLEISQTSQENACARVSFLIKLQPQLWHKDKDTLAQAFSYEICEISKNNFS